MPLLQTDTENADRNLASLVTVLTDTPHATKATLCQGLVVLGDGVKNLDGTGGDFSLTITVGGQTIQPDPQTVTFSTAVRSAVWTTLFPVPANTEVILRVLSPNAADTDVDVTAYLYEVTGALPDAASDAAGGLPISDAGGLDLDALATAAKLLAYVQLLARSDAAIETDNATELAEINADGGSGAGDFSSQTDAVEALRSQSDLIVADTNELQTDWADDGRLDEILDAVSGVPAITLSTEGTNLSSED